MIDILEYVFNWRERRGQTTANHKRISCFIDCHEFITYTGMTIVTCTIARVNRLLSLTGLVLVFVIQKNFCFQTRQVRLLKKEHKRTFNWQSLWIRPISPYRDMNISSFPKHFFNASCACSLSRDTKYVKNRCILPSKVSSFNLETVTNTCIRLNPFIHTTAAQ